MQNRVEVLEGGALDRGNSSTELDFEGAVPPYEWGMYLAQLTLFVDVCQTHAEKWQGLKNETNDFGKKSGYVDAYQLNNHYVKAWTAGTGCSVSRIMNLHKPLAATHMISHAWAEDMNQVVSALQRSPKVQERDVVWFCLLACYQPEDGHGPTITCQLELDPFGLVIASARHMLVIHTTTADVYDRLWCCYECDVAIAEEEKRMNINKIKVHFVEHAFSVAFIEKGTSDVEMHVFTKLSSMYRSRIAVVCWVVCSLGGGITTLLVSRSAFFWG